MLSARWSMGLFPIDSPSLRSVLILILPSYWHCWKWDSIHHQSSAARLETAELIKMHTSYRKHLNWLLCYQWRGRDAIMPVLSALLSNALCLSENWRRGIKPACLSSLSRTYSWSMFSVSVARYISVFSAAARSNRERKINSSNPHFWGVLHFQAA